MKRTTISTTLADRIEHLMGEDRSARNGTCGPLHDPYACLDARIDVRSTLGRFLTSKGHVNKELAADFGRWFTVITVSLDRNFGHPFLKMRAIAV